MKNKGFTLVELLVVIAIIGLLSAMAVVSLGSIREKGRDARRLSDMDALKTAFELVNSEAGSYDNDEDSDCVAGDMVYECTGGALENYLPSLKNMKDPADPSVDCQADCTGPCEYSVVALSADSFEVNFYLEQGAGKFDQPGCYMLSEKGIEKK